MSNRTRRTRPPRTTLVRWPLGPATDGNVTTRWNGEPARAVKIAVMVARAPEFPHYWADQYVDTIRQAVRVDYGSQHFYLDNEDGTGWRKVTDGRGMPNWPHRNLAITVEVPEATR